jgi:hypothetical protein
MARALRGAGLLALALTLPAFAVDPPAKDQYKPVNQLAGKVAKVDTQESTITLKVEEVNLRPTGRRVRAEGKEKDVDLTLAPEVKVRTAVKPERHDEGGKPKPYTPQELEKLRAKDVPPSLGKFYVTDMNAVAAGQTVQVFIGVPKDAAASAKSKDGLAVAAAAKDKPAVYQILILAEEKAASDAKDKKKQP